MGVVRCRSRFLTIGQKAGEGRFGRPESSSESASYEYESSVVLPSAFQYSTGLPRPSWRHATCAALSSKPSSQTVPHFTTSLPASR